jgi:5-formyltetrahydrofolate cyclo-ligase
MACTLKRPRLNHRLELVSNTSLAEALKNLSLTGQDLSELRKNLRQFLIDHASKGFQTNWFPNSETTDIFLDFTAEHLKHCTQKTVGTFFPSTRLQEVSPQWMNHCLIQFQKKDFSIAFAKTLDAQEMSYFELSARRETTVHFNLKIEEPKVGPDQKVLWPGLYLIPCWIADRQFNRLGRGRGFFDRYIGKVRQMERTSNQKSLFIGLVHPLYLVPQIPPEFLHSGDQKLDGILTTDSLTLSNLQLEKN